MPRKSSYRLAEPNRSHRARSSSTPTGPSVRSSAIAAAGSLSPADPTIKSRRSSRLAEPAPPTAVPPAAGRSASGMRSRRLRRAREPWPLGDPALNVALEISDPALAEANELRSGPGDSGLFERTLAEPKESGGLGGGENFG